jgi:hypothetical protein
MEPALALDGRSQSPADRRVRIDVRTANRYYDNVIGNAVGKCLTNR